jgi:hypothetical protein
VELNHLPVIENLKNSGDHYLASDEHSRKHYAHPKILKASHALLVPNEVNRGQRLSA